MVLWRGRGLRFGGQGRGVRASGSLQSKYDNYRVLGLQASRLEGWDFGGCRRIAHSQKRLNQKHQP